MKQILALAAALALTGLLPFVSSAKEAYHGVAMGAQTCSQSTCHAAERPWPNSAVSQIEYKVWRERDPHAQSYKALQSPRAKAIAARTGQGDPTKAELCLGCHAFTPPPDKREATYDITEGVTCEACHGAASGWLGVHTAGLYFYSKNIERGMYPTTDPTKRAELCLDCHVGSGDKFITHNMMAAGHPKLPFELGFYSWFQKTNPEARAGYAHFTVDDDYLQRKPWPFGVKVWAIGQVAQARRVLELVTDPKNGPKGLFPELSLFDCHSCHRSSKGDGVSGVALPRIKSANLLFAGFAADLVDPALGRRLRGDISNLRAASQNSWGGVIAASSRLKRTLDTLASRLDDRTFTVADNKRTLLRIANAYRRGQLDRYEEAEQAVLAAGSLVDELDRLDVLPAADAAAAVDAMTQGVSAFKSANNYSRSDVRASMNTIARVVSN